MRESCRRIRKRPLQFQCSNFRIGLQNRQKEEFKETFKTIIPVRLERYLNQIFTDFISQLK